MKWFFGVLVCVQLFAVEVASPKKPPCEELRLYKDLKIYKDPSLFQDYLSMMSTDPQRAWQGLSEESVVLGSFVGKLYIQRFSEPESATRFLKLAPLIDFYAQAEPRISDDPKRSPNVVKVRICTPHGETMESYADTLGFVFESDLRDSQIQKNENHGLPPSIYPNPIPKLKN